MRTFSPGFYLLALLLFLPWNAAQAATITIDFESYGVPANSYVNHLGQAPDSIAFFVVEGTSFVNYWDTTWGDYWEGWSLSKVSTLQYDGPDLLGFENQYASAPASGSGGSATYAIGHTNGFAIGDSYFNLAPDATPVSVDITNAAYAYGSMLHGDGFAKQFSALDNDYFRLQITGHAGADKTGATIGVIDVHLSQTQLDQLLILTDWETVDLTSLAGSQSLSFHLTSSDNSPWGMNTPAYFALDNFVFSTASESMNPAPEPSTGWLLFGAACCFVRRRGAGRRFAIEPPVGGIIAAAR